jgi:hypothetical protein
VVLLLADVGVGDLGFMCSEFRVWGSEGRGGPAAC